MNINNISIGAIVAQVAAIISTIVSYALLLLIAAAVAAKFGVRVPYVPQQNETALAWLCGAWWLYRGGKL